MAILYQWVWSMTASPEECGLFLHDPFQVETLDLLVHIEASGFGT